MFEVTKHLNEALNLKIGDKEITVRCFDVDGNQVTIGLSTPDENSILNRELLQQEADL